MKSKNYAATSKPYNACGEIFELYGMSLKIDKSTGRLIITNSILKKKPVGKFISVCKDSTT